MAESATTNRHSGDAVRTVIHLKWREPRGATRDGRWIIFLLLTYLPVLIVGGLLTLLAPDLVGGTPLAEPAGLLAAFCAVFFFLIFVLAYNLGLRPPFWRSQGVSHYLDISPDRLRYRVGSGDRKIVSTLGRDEAGDMSLSFTTMRVAWQHQGLLRLTDVDGEVRMTMPDHRVGHPEDPKRLVPVSAFVGEWWPNPEARAVIAESHRGPWTVADPSSIEVVLVPSRRQPLKAGGIAFALMATFAALLGLTILTILTAVPAVVLLLWNIGRRLEIG
jgi:hypothetical protein